MSTLYHLVIPTGQLFRGVQRQKDRLYHNTDLDFTGLVEMCLTHWHDLTLLVNETDPMAKSAFYDSLLIPHLQDRKKLSYKKTLLTSNALGTCLEACYASIEPWIHLAREHFKFDVIDRIQAKSYISHSGLVLEIAA